MSGFPVHLQYRLMRRQRLLPHLILWGSFGPLFVCLTVVFLAAAVAQSPWFAIAALAMLWFVRRYLYGFIDIALHRSREMDIIFEPLGIGYLAGGERWYIHLDGVSSIREFIPGVITIAHHSGAVINVPAELMPQPCIDHIRAAVERGWEYLQPFADEHKRRLDAKSDLGATQ